MIYSKASLDGAIKHILPGVKIDPLAYEKPAVLLDLFAVISAIYFILSDEELEDLNPSVKYAFVVIRKAAREFDDHGKIEYGVEDVEYLGEPLKI